MKLIFLPILLLTGCASQQQPVASAASAQSFIQISSAQNIATVIAPKQTPFSEPATGLYWIGTNSGGGFNIYYGVGSHSYQWVSHADTNYCAVTVPYIDTRYFFAATAVNSNGVESDFSNEFSCFVDQNSARIFRFYAVPMADPAIDRTQDCINWTPAPGCFPVAINADGMDWFIPVAPTTTFYRLKGTPR